MARADAHDKGDAGHGGAAAHRPIDHVVILVKENHTFDNYFGTFPGADGVTMSRSPNPPPKDPDHRHAAWLTRATTSVRKQFVEIDIPAYFEYARQFTLCDRYFTDVAGPSTPNHLMLIAADSPFIDNPPHHGAGGPTFNLPSLPGSLEKVGQRWGNYGGYAFDLVRELHGRPHLRRRASCKTPRPGSSRRCRGSTRRTTPPSTRRTRAIRVTRSSAT